MAKQIVILETNTDNGGAFSVRLVFWFPIVAGKQVPIPALTKSLWTGASAAEITALQNGSVVEELRNFSFAKTETTANIKLFLAKAYADRKTYLDSLPFVGQFYGIYLDDTTGWSA